MDFSEIKKRANALKRSLSAIERLDKDRNLNFVEIKKQIERVKSSERERRLSEAVQEWLSEYESDVSRAASAAQRRFGTELEAELRPDGIGLSGQIHSLKAGLFTIEPDFEDGKVVIWYGPKQERIETARSVSAKEIAKIIRKHNKTLASSPFEQEKFLKQLHNAYLGTLRRRKLADGEYAPIISVLIELSFHLQSSRFLTDPSKDNFRDYGRMMFSYDLHRLRARRLLDQELVLSTATRAHTRKRQDFLWIPRNEGGDGSTYSHIMFRKESK